MIKVAILACVALLTACASQPSASTASPPAVAATSRSVREYSVIMGGAVAGTEVVNVEGETRLIAYEYNDRGRGPKTNTTLKLDRDFFTAEMRRPGSLISTNRTGRRMQEPSPRCLPLPQHRFTCCADHPSIFKSGAPRRSLMRSGVKRVDLVVAARVQKDCP